MINETKATYLRFLQRLALLLLKKADIGGPEVGRSVIRSLMVVLLKVSCLRQLGEEPEISAISKSVALHAFDPGI